MRKKSYVARARKFKWKELGFSSWLEYQRHYRKIYYRAWYLKNKARHAEYMRQYNLRTKAERHYKEWYKKHYLNKAK